MFSKAAILCAASFMVAVTAVGTTSEQQYYSPYARNYANRSYASAPRYQQRGYRPSPQVLAQPKAQPKSPYPAFKLSYKDYKELKDEIEALKAASSGGASAEALTALTTRVDTAEGKVMTLEDADTVDPDAFTALTTRVGTAEGKVMTLEGEVEALEDADTVDPDDFTALTTRVGTAEGKVMTLEGEVDDLQDADTASELAASMLTTRVGTAEGKVMTLEGEVDALEAADTVDPDDVTALTTRVGNAETATTSLTMRVSTAEGDVVSLKATTGTLEDQAVVKAGWKETEIVVQEIPGTVLTIAEFCLEGPAVAEVSALISVLPVNPRVQLRLYVDDGSGKLEKTFQIVQDTTLNDMIGVHWMGDIAADATVYIELSGITITGNVVRRAGSISYKLYDASYPFDEGLPDPCGS